MSNNIVIFVKSPNNNNIIAREIKYLFIVLFLICIFNFIIKDSLTYYFISLY